MDAKKKRYLIVIAGIILIMAGIVLYYISRPKESVKRAKDITTITVERESRHAPLKTNDIENFRAESLPKPQVVNVRYKSQPLNFAYEKKGFKPSIPHYVGTKRPGSDLDGLKIVCSGKQCERQIITARATAVEKPCAESAMKPSVVKKDVVFSHNSLEYLRPNVRIIGNLYIHGIDFIRIPRNFMVIGDVYVIDSEGVTFMGDSMIDGHIFVRGKSSIRALPRDVTLTGQIFI